MATILQSMMRGRHSAVTDPNLKVQVGTGMLYISYPCRTSNVQYNIATPNGKVAIKGDFDNEADDNNIDISRLNSGNYTLYIIDGADLIKYPFSIK
ncbi:MAG TPA: hypothetical protein PK637_16145 [Flavobacteriales bacterium]|nr:hypothetical protein [Flavobacteriales bacterium]HRE98296.1 hypothetical protein [Flavobacteriales bacterium]